MLEHQDDRFEGDRTILVVVPLRVTRSTGARRSANASFAHSTTLAVPTVREIWAIRTMFNLPA
jgi:hypothetical protein